MIYPAVPRYLTEEEVAALRKGDHANVDSGLGGSFSVRFEGHEEDKFIFNNVSPDFENWSEYRFTFDEVRQRVHQLVIDPRYAREIELVTDKTYEEVVAMMAEKERRYWLTKERAGG